MKILSLFDGISIAQQAFKELGVEIEYYASEIDKEAISITQKNHPNTKQLGDVKNINYLNEHLLNLEEKLDFIIGGSPCQDLSIAKKNREGLKGERSGLFWEYTRILKELKPKYFILENVASMSQEVKNTITEELWGIEPVMINAALFSAQQRKRLFWVGKLSDNHYQKVSITEPEDKKIYLKDILESGDAVKEKAYCLTTGQKDFINDFIKRHQGNYVFKDKPIKILNLNKGGQSSRVYLIHGKSVCLSSNGGYGGARTGLYLITSTELNSPQTNIYDDLIILKDYFRPLTPVECERLQSLPDNYTEGLSKNKRTKVLGNGFNCAVIKHIIRNILGI